MSFVQVSVLQGSRESHSALCYLLHIDSALLLLDCGWSLAFNSDSPFLAALKDVAPQVDAVLLSHPDISHIGALPYAFAKLGLNCPIYCTVPVDQMGQQCLYDTLKSKLEDEEFTVFTAEDVRTVFKRTETLNYMQNFGLSGRCKGITITPYAAGHSIGGTVWKIKKENDEIVYAVDYNHNKERHLNATSLRTSNDLKRASVLITDCFNCLNVQIPRPQRDAALLDQITRTLAAGGNVLIPTDSSARVLELLYFLNLKFQQAGIQYPLLFLSHSASQTIQIAKRLLDWMRKELTDEFNSSRVHPFDFKNAQTIQKLSDLEKYPGPKVVLSSLPSLDHGFSKTLMTQWCANPNNLILLPDRGEIGTTTRRFFDLWSKHVSTEGGSGIGSPIGLTFSEKITVTTRIPLQGAELSEYLSKTLPEQHKPKNILDEDDDDDDSDIEPEYTHQTPKNPNVSTVETVQFDIYVKDAVKSSVGFFKQAKSFYMFPVRESKRRVDDYGEVIDVDVFVRESGKVEAKEEERMEIDNVERDEVEIEKVPSKYETEEKEILFNCKLMYIDFEGRADGTSIKNIISQLLPRKLILVHGTVEATNDLHRYCLDSNEITNEIFSPDVGETVNVSAARNMYQVKLTDSLFSSLKPSKIGDYELFYVNGLLKIPHQTDTDAQVPTSPSSPSSPTASTTADPTSPPPSPITKKRGFAELSVNPILDLPPTSKRVLHKPVLIGNIKLTEFKNVIVKEYMRIQEEDEEGGNVGSGRNGGEEKMDLSCKIEGGVLVVGDKVVVKKMGSGVLGVEGPYCQEYFKVRNLLYSQMAVL